MRQRWKRSLSAFLAGVMLLTLCPLPPASAAGSDEVITILNKDTDLPVLAAYRQYDVTDPFKTAITEGGSFRVEYTVDDSGEGKTDPRPILVLTGSGSGQDWVNVEPTTHNVDNQSGGKYAEFTYAACTDTGKWSGSFDTLTKVAVQLWSPKTVKPITVTRIAYIPSEASGTSLDDELPPADQENGDAALQSGNPDTENFPPEIEDSKDLPSEDEDGENPQPGNEGNVSAAQEELSAMRLLYSATPVEITIPDEAQTIPYAGNNYVNYDAKAELKNAIKEGGYFTIEYTPGEGQNPTIALLLTSSWTTIGPSATSEPDANGKRKSTYTYADCTKIKDNGSATFDFTNLVKVGAQNWTNNTTATIHSITYTNPGQSGGDGETPTLTATQSFLGQELTVSGGTSWQWYRSEWNTAENGEAISGATDAAYTPAEADLRHYLYCVVNGTTTLGPVPVFAEDTTITRVLAEPGLVLPYKNASGNDTYSGQVFAVNTAASVGFDMHMVTPGGKFRMTYTSSDGAAPTLVLCNDSNSGLTTWGAVTGANKTTNNDGSFTLEYSYDSFLAKNTNTTSKEASPDFSQLARLQAQIANGKNATITKLEWVGTAVDKPPVTAGGSLSSESAFLRQAISVGNNYTSGYTYQWYRLSHYGVDGGAAIDGATNSSYTPTGLDLGSYLYCVATPTNGGSAVHLGSAAVFASNATVTTDLLSVGTVSVPSGDTFMNLISMQRKRPIFTTQMIAPGGKFVLEGPSDATNVKLRLTVGGSNLDISGTSGSNSLEFSYEACKSAYAALCAQRNIPYEGLDGLTAVGVVDTGTAKSDITALKWVGPDTGEIPHTSSSSSLGYTYLKHAGGEFDTTKVRADGNFYMILEGSGSGEVKLSLSSFSILGSDKTAAHQLYASVSPAESGSFTDGRLWFRYSVDSIVNAFKNAGGTDSSGNCNLGRWDKIDFNKDSTLTVTSNSDHFFYADGTGAVVEQNPNDTKWLNKTHKDGGIAFIGASIVQNTLVNSSVYENGGTVNGDWNLILGRTDCDNYGIGGETSQHVINRFHQILASDCNYRAIVTQFGSNDLGQEDTDELVAARMVRNYKLILEELKAHNVSLAQAGNEPIKLVAICVLPTTPDMYEGRGNRIKKVNDALVELFKSYNFAEFAAGIQDALYYTGTEAPTGNKGGVCTHKDERDNTKWEPHGDKQYYLADGLHPNYAGYMKIGEVINPLIGYDEKVSETWSDAGWNGQTGPTATVHDLTATSIKVKTTDATEGSGWRAAAIKRDVSDVTGVGSITMKADSTDGLTFYAYVGGSVDGTWTEYRATGTAANGTVTFSEFHKKNGDTFEDAATTDDLAGFAPTQLVIQYGGNSKLPAELTLTNIQIVEPEAEEYSVTFSATNADITNAGQLAGLTTSAFKQANGSSAASGSYTAGTKITVVGAVWQNGTAAHYLQSVKVNDIEQKIKKYEDNVITITKDATITADYKFSATKPEAEPDQPDPPANATLIEHIVPYTADGKITGTGANGTSAGYVYLKHAGGDFDTTQVKDDGYFYLLYYGTDTSGNPAGKVHLSFSSYSFYLEGTTNTPYVTINPTESGTVGNEGWYYAKFSVAAVKSAFGTNFGRLDHIGLYLKQGLTISAKTARLYYVDGTGAYTETNHTADPITGFPWTNRTHKDGGIAFIGDSIVHNPLVNSTVGLTPDRGDWNAILGRTDCDNYGIGGEKSQHIANRFAELTENGDYRYIVTLFGINNLGNGNEATVTNQVIGDYTKVLNTAKAAVANSGKKLEKVFVISLLPSTPLTYEGVQYRIQHVNTALENLCKQDDYKDFVTFVNVYPKLLYTGNTPLTDGGKTCGANGSDNDGNTFDGYEPHGDPKFFFSSDGLHPNASGYAEIAKVLNPLLGYDETVSTTWSDAGWGTPTATVYDLAGTGIKVKTADTTGDTGWRSAAVKRSVSDVSGVKSITMEADSTNGLTFYAYVGGNVSGTWTEYRAQGVVSSGAVTFSEFHKKSGNDYEAGATTDDLSEFAPTQLVIQYGGNSTLPAELTLTDIQIVEPEAAACTVTFAAKEGGNDKGTGETSVNFTKAAFKIGGTVISDTTLTVPKGTKITVLGEVWIDASTTGGDYLSSVMVGGAAQVITKYADFEVTVTGDCTITADYTYFSTKPDPIPPADPNAPAIDGTEALLGAALQLKNADDATAVQWYRVEWEKNTGGTAIAGATGKTYTPVEDDLRHYLYCVVDGKTVDPVPVFAANETVTKTLSSDAKTAAKDTTQTLMQLSNAASVGFDRHMITPGGKFVMECTGSGTPKLCLSNWKASSTGATNGWVELDGTKNSDGAWEFSYEKCVEKFGADFSVLDALTLKAVSDSVTATSLKWVGKAVDKPAEKPQNTGNLTAQQAFLGQNISVESSFNTTGYTYQWYRLSHYGLVSGQPIAGATGTSYAPTALDLGSYVYCVATAAQGNVKHHLGPAAVFAKESKVTTNLYTGEMQVTAGQSATLIQMNQKRYLFNGIMLAPGGQFVLDSTGGAADTKLVLTIGGMNLEIAGTESGGKLVFPYDACADAYKSRCDQMDVAFEGLSGLATIAVKNGGSGAITLKSLTWEGYDTGEVMHVVPWTENDSKTGPDTAGYTYLGHIGGDFDTTQIRADGNFYLIYEGTAPGKMYLSLASFSMVSSETDQSYAELRPTESGSLGDGRHWSRFSVADLVKAFGSNNLGRWDKVDYHLSDVTVKMSGVHFYYADGTGSIVEPNPTNTSSWLNKTHKDGGIAFIGASIVQNPKVNGSLGLAVKYGDWNCILGREDCDNYGIGGETSEHIGRRFSQILADDCNYRAIVNQIASNDLGLEATDELVVARMVRNYKSILDQLKAHNDKLTAAGKTPIKLVTISALPTTPKTYEGAQNRIVAVNTELAKLYENYNFATYASGTWDALKYTGSGTLDGCTHSGEPHGDPKFFVGDGLHPNALGYAEIGKIINPLIDDNFTKEGKLDSDCAFLGKPVSVKAENQGAGITYQWYRSASNAVSGGTAIAGATGESYTPVPQDLGSYLYCVAAKDGKKTSLGAAAVFAAERVVTTTLYSGNATEDSSGFAAPIFLSQTGYKFNTGMIAPGGKFRVRYSGGSSTPSLCLSDWNSGAWAEINSTGTNGVAEFAYDDCAGLFGADFSGLSAIQLKANGATIQALEWVGYDTGEVMHVIPYTADGTMTASSDQTNVGYTYLGHVGGDFDTTKVKEDGDFYLIYEGNAQGKMYLSLSSYSSGDETKAASWSTVEPTESGSLGGGRYWSRIPVSSIVSAFGTNLGRWDHIGYYMHQGLTVKMNSVHLYYVDGTGNVVEQNPTDTKWTNKSHKDGGIAFIGDSIVHNPLVNSEVGLTPDKGDWNAILGRTDCDNYGIGGETSQHIRNRFAQLLAEDCNYRQIVTLFGINDLGLEATDDMVVERVIGNYKAVLDMVSASGKKPRDGMFVISLLPTTPKTYDGAQNRIVKVNTALKALCDQYDFVTFANVYPELLYTGGDTLSGCGTAGEPHGDPKFFFTGDGLHPNALGYAEIEKILNPLLGGEYTPPAPPPATEGVTGDANSFDVSADNLGGWTYGGSSWSNNGTSTGSLTATNNGMLKANVKFNSTNWSQAAITNWSDNGHEVKSGMDMISMDVYLEKSAVDASRGTMLAQIYEFGSAVPLNTTSEAVEVNGTQYYKTTLNIKGTFKTPFQNFAILFIARNSAFNGNILVGNIAFQKSQNEQVIKVEGNGNFSKNADGTTKTINFGNGESAQTPTYSNSGHSGRLNKGAKIKLTIKLNDVTDTLSGKLKVTVTITGTNGQSAEVTTTIEASAFHDVTRMMRAARSTGTAKIAEVEIDIPEEAIQTVENVKMVSVKAESADKTLGDMFSYNGTLDLTELTITNGPAAITSPYVDNGGGGSDGGGSGGGGGGGGSAPMRPVNLPHTWDFSKQADGWKYDKAWNSDYSGSAKTKVMLQDGRLRIDVDFSKDGDKSWSQLAVTLWHDSGMSIKGATHASLDFFYIPGALDGSFAMKLYSNAGIDCDAAVDTEEAETVQIGSITYNKVTVDFNFPAIRSGKVQDLAICLVGKNTTYKGPLYIDNITLNTEGNDIYVTSSLKPKKNNATLSVSGNTLTTASGETAAIPTQVTMADGGADANARSLYAYLKAVGSSKDVLFGQQYNFVQKVGSSSLSDSDTYDVVGDYAAIYGLDGLALSNNEFSASRCNELFGTNYPNTAAGHVAAAAYLTNKAIERGSIATLSLHMPNFSVVDPVSTSALETYAHYDFSGYTPGTLTGDVANEILPGGKYNEVFNAYLDMVADYAKQVKGAVLFRPFHENTGSWFWWGKAFCDPSTYQNIYRYTVEYLRDVKGVHNFLYAYGPGSEAKSLEDYAARYPGDSYVDLVGFDMYDTSFDVNSDWMKSFETELNLVERFAQVHGKLVAVTETGAANATAKGDSQTALLRSGNKDLDWYNRVLNVVSKSQASYFLVWANFGQTSGFYTPYVVRRNSDGSLYGHEMLDNFISYYNDSRSVFATDQKAVLGKLPSVMAKAVSDKAEGYITAPISGRRVLDATTFTARVTNAKGADVQFVLHGSGKDITMKAASSDGVYYRAQLDKASLESLGHYADGSAELVVNGQSQQTIKLIYNIPEPVLDRKLVDAFDTYYGVNGLLNKAWTVNSANGCSVTITLDQSTKYNGDAALKLEYTLTRDGYAGASCSRKTDWSGCNALQFWTIPDGNNQKVVIQVTAGGQVYEAYLNQYAEYTSRKEPVLVTVPFSEFVQRDASGQPKGGLVTDCKEITGFGLWVNTSELPQNGTVTGVLYYDNITAVENGPSQVTVVKAGSQFTDVPVDAYYFNAVQWALEQGITSGTTTTTFSPNNPCTRSQIVTFLWRAAGSPAPSSTNNPFKDLKPDAYYYNAVLWAVEKGITTGTTATTFSPNATVTRSQTVMFLYRSAGSPEAASSGSFADVAANAYYAKAVQWAVEKGVTNGTSANAFSPNNPCTRAQIVTFLYRAK